VLCCSVLCCIVLRCVVLCCVVLCCVVLSFLVRNVCLKQAHLFIYSLDHYTVSCSEKKGKFAAVHTMRVYEGGGGWWEEV
jgi:hypothetical protein